VQVRHNTLTIRAGIIDSFDRGDKVWHTNDTVKATCSMWHGRAQCLAVAQMNVPIVWLKNGQLSNRISHKVVALYIVIYGK
jgi:hypothetical protein